MTDTVDSLKQRLVGAFVIVTLAIIFLPMIFDKPHQQDSIVVVPVPPKPEFKTIEITKPIAPTFKMLEEDAKNGKVIEVSDDKKQNSAPLRQISSSDNKKSAALAKNNDAKSERSVTKREDKKDIIKSTKNETKSKPVVRNISSFKNVWMVQLGTFGNVKNAYNLRDKLRKDGFDGHTKVINLNGKKAVKVFSGPFVKKRDAIKTKKRLDNKYKVDSRVVFFDA